MLPRERTSTLSVFPMAIAYLAAAEYTLCAVSGLLDLTDAAVNVAEELSPSCQMARFTFLICPKPQTRQIGRFSKGASL